MSAFKTWLQHNTNYWVPYELDTLYSGWVDYKHDCHCSESSIMCKNSMKKRLKEMSSGDNPCVTIKKHKDKTVYFKKEERIVPIKTNYLLSELGQRAMKLYPNTLKWWR